MATTTPTGPIATVQARIASAQKALSDAQASYTASRAAILTDLAAHASAHQTAADAHAAEVKAANDLAGTLGEVAAVVTASPQIILTAAGSISGRMIAWVGKSWHWVVMIPAALALGYCLATGSLGVLKHFL